MPGFAPLRHYLRRLVYQSAMLQPIADRYSQHRHNGNSAVYWNEALTGDFSSYLGGTLSTELRNAIVATLVRNCVKPPLHVLDIGCAGGSLASAIDGLQRYTGTDVSDYAIAHAKRSLMPSVRGYGETTVEFVAADLRDFALNGPEWDVIVFNEVLYYLPVNQAVEQIGRYATALRENGVICVSMKDDGKCRAIFRQLQKRYAWKAGVLHQIKHERPDFQIRIDREWPAHIIAALQPRPHQT
jgi:2-polyprenyl-3-methyl-5-hydroxy-6-metoxy-1,4-benzoquinol methylase